MKEVDVSSLEHTSWRCQYHNFWKLAMCIIGEEYAAFVFAHDGSAHLRPMLLRTKKSASFWGLNTVHIAGSKTILVMILPAVNWT